MALHHQYHSLSLTNQRPGDFGSSKSLKHFHQINTKMKKDKILPFSTVALLFCLCSPFYFHTAINQKLDSI